MRFDKGLQVASMILWRISETWAHQGITDAELHIDVPERQAWKRRWCIISEELNAGLNGELTSNTFQESIWCNIKTGKSSMLVNLCYRCPTSSESTNDSLLKLITKASDLCSYSGVGSNFQVGGGQNAGAKRRPKFF